MDDFYAQPYDHATAVFSGWLGPIHPEPGSYRREWSRQRPSKGYRKHLRKMKARERRAAA
jgi:hypothetical protein